MRWIEYHRDETGIAFIKQSYNTVGRNSVSDKVPTASAESSTPELE